MKSSPAAAPEVSVIVPVLQEGLRILAVLENLAAAATGVAYEVIVVDGDPTGSTLVHIPELPWVRSLIAPQGRGIQMNWGAQIGQSPILLFLHADTQLPPGALAQIQKRLMDPQWVGGAFDLAIASPHRVLGWIARLASWRSRLTRIPYGDQGIFLRTDYFRELGGYPEIPIMEDVALMDRIRRQGGQIQFLNAHVLTSARRWEAEGWLYCTLRNWLLLSLYALGVEPTTLVRWYPPPKGKGASRP